MAYLQAIFLGLVQGITEFLPISSTAHLLVVTQIWGWQEVGEKYYVDAMQFGSVVAVILYFYNDIRLLVAGTVQACKTKDWQGEEWRITAGIVVGTVPVLVLGFIFRHVIPESPIVIGVTSIVMAILLGLAELKGTRKRSFADLQIWDGLWVGLGQTIALIPGASRSGTTLTTALFLGLERQTAARFSFLLGIPTLTIATLFQSRQAFGHRDTLLLLGVGMISSFVFSYLAIAWLLRFFQTKSSWVFIWYRLTFGIVLIASKLLLPWQ
ncbi:MAG: undecaprenyl-diphosphate phosphatase [Pseudanabaenaceae cyanobacterium SKYGB_i_bin29]|nr:undecaprenyl-diphosphate phosphatase [Pseudanabaenaceae cyanobacterium SKYG29]MDW8422518.1 undecaprenyl-diphosphate phosphatase [Pseudanabaenaceae cyanobacterium SKYGB_i_bin29]